MSWPQNADEAKQWQEYHRMQREALERLKNANTAASGVSLGMAPVIPPPPPLVRYGSGTPDTGEVYPPYVTESEVEEHFRRSLLGQNPPQNIGYQGQRPTFQGYPGHQMNAGQGHTSVNAVCQGLNAYTSRDAPATTTTGNPVLQGQAAGSRGAYRQYGDASMPRNVGGMANPAVIPPARQVPQNNIPMQQSCRWGQPQNTQPINTNSYVPPASSYTSPPIRGQLRDNVNPQPSTYATSPGFTQIPFGRQQMDMPAPPNRTAGTGVQSQIPISQNPSMFGDIGQQPMPTPRSQPQQFAGQSQFPRMPMPAHQQQPLTAQFHRPQGQPGFQQHTGAHVNPQTFRAPRPSHTVGSQPQHAGHQPHPAVNHPPQVQRPTKPPGNQSQQVPSGDQGFINLAEIADQMRDFRRHQMNQEQVSSTTLSDAVLIQYAMSKIRQRQLQALKKGMAAPVNQNGSTAGTRTSDPNVSPDSMIRDKFVIQEQNDRDLMGRWYAQPSPKTAGLTEGSNVSPESDDINRKLLDLMMTTGVDGQSVSSATMVSLTADTHAMVTMAAVCSATVTMMTTSTVAETSRVTTTDTCSSNVIHEPSDTGKFQLKPCYIDDDIIEYKVADLLRCLPKKLRYRTTSSDRNPTQESGQNAITETINYPATVNDPPNGSEMSVCPPISNVLPEAANVETPTVPCDTVMQIVPAPETYEPNDVDMLPEPDSILQEHKKRLFEALTLDTHFGTQDMNPEIDYRHYIPETPMAADSPDVMNILADDTVELPAPLDFSTINVEGPQLEDTHQKSQTSKEIPPMIQSPTHKIAIAPNIPGDTTPSATGQYAPIPSIISEVLGSFTPPRVEIETDEVVTDIHTAPLGPMEDDIGLSGQKRKGPDVEGSGPPNKKFRGRGLRRGGRSRRGSSRGRTWAEQIGTPKTSQPVRGTRGFRRGGRSRGRRGRAGQTNHAVEERVNADIGTAAAGEAEMDTISRINELHAQGDISTLSADNLHGKLLSNPEDLKAIVNSIKEDELSKLSIDLLSFKNLMQFFDKESENKPTKENVKTVSKSPKQKLKVKTFSPKRTHTTSKLPSPHKKFPNAEQICAKSPENATDTGTAKDATTNNRNDNKETSGKKSPSYPSKKGKNKATPIVRGSESPDKNTENAREVPPYSGNVSAREVAPCSGNVSARDVTPCSGKVSAREITPCSGSVSEESNDGMPHGKNVFYKDTKVKMEMGTENDENKPSTSKQLIDKTESSVICVSDTHKMTWVRFHGKVVTRLIMPNGNFFIMSEIIRRCFRIQGEKKNKRLQHILLEKKNVLKIPEIELDQVYFKPVVKNLTDRQVIKTQPTNFTVITEDNANRLFHHICADRYCADGCITHWYGSNEKSKGKKEQKNAETPEKSGSSETVPKSEKREQNDQNRKGNSDNKVGGRQDRNIFDFVVDLCSDEDDGYKSDVTMPYVDGQPTERLQDIEAEVTNIHSAIGRDVETKVTNVQVETVDDTNKTMENVEQQNESSMQVDDQSSVLRLPKEIQQDADNNSEIARNMIPVDTPVSGSSLDNIFEKVFSDMPDTKMNSTENSGFNIDTQELRTDQPSISEPQLVNSLDEVKIHVDESNKKDMYKEESEDEIILIETDEESHCSGKEPDEKVDEKNTDSLTASVTTHEEVNDTTTEDATIKIRVESVTSQAIEQGQEQTDRDCDKPPGEMNEETLEKQNGSDNYIGDQKQISLGKLKTSVPSDLSDKKTIETKLCDKDVASVIILDERVDQFVHKQSGEPKASEGGSNKCNITIAHDTSLIEIDSESEPSSPISNAGDRTIDDNTSGVSDLSEAKWKVLKTGGAKNLKEQVPKERDMEVHVGEQPIDTVDNSENIEQTGEVVILKENTSTTAENSAIDIDIVPDVEINNKTDGHPKNDQVLQIQNECTEFELEESKKQSVLEKGSDSDHNDITDNKDSSPELVLVEDSGDNEQVDLTVEKVDGKWCIPQDGPMRIKRAQQQLQAIVHRANNAKGKDEMKALVAEVFKLTKPLKKWSAILMNENEEENGTRMERLRCLEQMELEDEQFDPSMIILDDDSDDMEIVEERGEITLEN